MPGKKTKTRISPGRVPHTGRRPKARDIGPDVLCAGPTPPKKLRKLRAKTPPIVKGPPIVLTAPASGSAVRSMAKSLAAADLRSVASILESEDSLSKNLNGLQTTLFVGGMVFLFRGSAGLAASVLAIGTFAPMLIRWCIARWRNKLIGRRLSP